MREGGGRLAVLLWGAALALAPPPPSAGQEGVEIGFRGEIRPRWEVTPERASVRVRRGEIFDAGIKVGNKSDREVMAMVLTEIAPPAAANYLVHLGCGPTFTLILKPGEATRVPNSYFVAEGTPGDTRAIEVAYTVYSFEALGRDPLEVGREIYAMRCVTCHGVLGRGDGPIARLLHGGVADLAPALRAKGDSELLDAVAAGVGPMPAFAPALGASERRAVLLYIRNLGGRAR